MNPVMDIAESLEVLIKVALFFASAFILGLTLQKVLDLLRVFYVLYGMFSGRPKAILRVLRVMFPPDAGLENVIGDLYEEYNEFPSGLDADPWLRKQLFESLPYLLLKIIKRRLASYFGERVR